jgi:hypothetical protein
MAAETPEGASSTYGNRDDASVILARRLGRRFEVSSQGRYSRRGATDTYPKIDQYLVGLFLSLISPGGGSGSRPER